MHLQLTYRVAPQSESAFYGKDRGGGHAAPGKTPRKYFELILFSSFIFWICAATKKKPRAGCKSTRSSTIGIFQEKSWLPKRLCNFPDRIAGAVRGAVYGYILILFTFFLSSLFTFQLNSYHSKVGGKLTVSICTTAVVALWLKLQCAQSTSCKREKERAHSVVQLMLRRVSFEAQ